MRNTDMTTQEIFDELTSTWMGNASVATLFGFEPGRDFDEVYSKVSVLRLLMWVVAYVIALKETKLDEWKREVRDVASATHYGTSAWWIAKAKAWQEGDALQVIDGKVDYPSVDVSKRRVTAASVTVMGRTLRIKVAKGEVGNLQGLTDAQKESFVGYVEAIKPMGLMVSVTTGSANNMRLYGTVRYSAERMKADVKMAVKNAIDTMLQNLEFNGTIYSGRLVQAIMSVDGVEDVFLTMKTMDGVEWTDAVEPSNGYAKLDVDGLNYEAL